ncbi:hypothetical protein [Pseudazoarcus pumilus]|uniref:hypothetical protein n=1 Tax=Pseudazoarcus pumilus TaxID=2067960 RepID=UPI0013DA771D|nr:hypothetical protein [Pseudazoarcus pumilus]
MMLRLPDRMNSVSERIWEWPLKSLRRLSGRLMRGSMKTAQRPLAWCIRFVLQRPFLSNPINRVLTRFPGIYRYLLSVARRNGVLEGQVSGRFEHGPGLWWHGADASQLPPGARRVHAELRRIVEDERGAND